MTIEDAATVMLLAEADEGVEVFMLERHLDSDFVGGAYVFPGGKVDEGDLGLPQSLTAGSVCPALIEAVGSKLARGLAVAAIRETFEECGVLLGMVEGAPVASERLTEPSFVQARRRLATRNRPWDWTPWLEATGVTLDLDALAWWSWWVTPEGVHRR
ncbi:MAG: NUDIX hydrolase, partial [Acidimicrobiia bacterium]|nr:NUDIX hydrolase [Acidimicrobiia bacterium]